MHNSPPIDMESRIIADLVRDGLRSLKEQRGVSGVDSPIGSCAKNLDLCEELRATRRWIGTKQLSQLLCCHPETIRKQIKLEPVMNFIPLE